MMMNQRIRTIGFSLLGGGRGQDGMPIINPKPSNRVAEGMKRLGSGRCSKGGGEVDVDPELADLMASDEGTYDKPVSSSLGQSTRAGSGGMQEEGTQVTPGCEGYFELCVKSVEAVSWDPESEANKELWSRRKKAEAAAAAAAFTVGRA